MLDFIQQIDRNIIDFIHYNLQHETANKVMAFLTSIGEYGFIWIILIIIMFLSEKHRKIACIAAMSFLLSRLIGAQILKPLISRPRPFHELDYLSIYISPPTTYSFPSGHALSSFSTAWVVMELIEELHYKALVIILAVLIASSRIYLMVHYPSDTLAGIAIGIMTSYFALFIFRETIVERR
ncbi:phosphatase PAP2 family protein [Wukongibacter baidiensis]|uniref:phosphatase PAP2 family protein n=1 Tax=Wukongibacter baidiensis TaxID=1723361 RepID=UPI003D7F59B0